MLYSHGHQLLQRLLMRTNYLMPRMCGDLVSPFGKCLLWEKRHMILNSSLSQQILKLRLRLGSASTNLCLQQLPCMHLRNTVCELYLRSRAQRSSHFLCAYRYDIMKSCWHLDPKLRPTFNDLKERFEEELRNAQLR